MDMLRKQAPLILGLVCAMYVLSFFHRVCPAIIALDLSRDLGVSPDAVALFSSATFFSYGLMQLPSGLLADALGGRKALVLLSLLAGTGAAAFALAPSATWMTGARFAMGVGLAVTVPGMVLLAAWFPSRSFGRASSTMLGCGGLGSLLAAPPLAFLSARFGWRVPILGAAGLTLALAVILWFCVRDSPEPQAQRPKPSARALWQGIRQVLRSKAFWPPALWSMGAMGAYFAMVSLWFGPYLMQACGLSQEAASAVLSAGAVVSLLIQPTVGWLSDVVLKSRKKPMWAGSVIGVAVALLMALCPVSAFWQAGALMVSFILGSSAASPMSYAILKENFPQRLVGTAAGCMNMLPPLWSIALQSAYGLVQKNVFLSTGDYGAAYGAACWVLVVNFAAILILCFFIRESFGREQD
ncbi:MAG: MFS transporter [Desulfovibrionaceae bacterium]|nr:MFS transporter [Desulfovibrionaceae bacterium]